MFGLVLFVLQNEKVIEIDTTFGVAAPKIRISSFFFFMEINHFGKGFHLRVMLLQVEFLVDKILVATT